MPGLATAPLPRTQRKLLTTASEEAYSMLSEFMHLGRPGQDAGYQRLHDALSALLGYDRPGL